MKANFLYNWPPNKDSVRFSLGGGNIEDSKYEFQVLFIEKDSEVAKHFGKNEWIDLETATQIEHDFIRGAKIKINKRLKENHQEVKNCLFIDTAEQWPVEALGESSTNVYFDF